MHLPLLTLKYKHNALFLLYVVKILFFIYLNLASLYFNIVLKVWYCA